MDRARAAGRRPWSSPTSRPRSVRRGRDRSGGVDGLVLNVGIGRGRRPRRDDRATTGTHVRGQPPLPLPRVPRGAAGRWPRAASIVFISSVAGLQPGSRLPAYDASKAGARSACAATSPLEGARRGVRANVVAPGLIDTPLGRWASARPAVAGAHAGAARPAGHRVGGRGGRRVPAVATTPATSPARCSPSTAASASSDPRTIGAVIVDHLGIQCADLDAGAAFYDTVLAPLGGARIMDFGVAIGYGVGRQPDFWIGAADRRAARPGSPHRVRGTRTAPRCGPSSTPRSRPAPRCCTSRGSGPSTTRPTTARSYATPTATTSRRSATTPE